MTIPQDDALIESIRREKAIIREETKGMTDDELIEYFNTTTDEHVKESL